MLGINIIDYFKIYNQFIIVHTHLEYQTVSRFSNKCNNKHANVHGESQSTAKIICREVCLIQFPDVIPKQRYSYRWFVITLSSNMCFQPVDQCAEKIFSFKDVRSIVIYDQSMIMELFAPAASSLVCKKYDIDSTCIVPGSRSLLKQIRKFTSRKTFRKQIIIQPPKQSLNHIVLFANGKFYNRAIVPHLFTQMLHGMQQSSKRRKHHFDILLTKDEVFFFWKFLLNKDDVYQTNLRS
jgi:hypothetical protein